MMINLLRNIILRVDLCFIWFWPLGEEEEANKRIYTSVQASVLMKGNVFINKIHKMLKNSTDTLPFMAALYPGRQSKKMGRHSRPKHIRSEEKDAKTSKKERKEKVNFRYIYLYLYLRNNI